MMHRIRKAPSAGRKHFPPLPLAFFAALLLVAGPVAARQCPRGQFLRVSKNICVPKGETIGRHVFYGPTFHGPTVQTKASPESEPEAEAAAYAPNAGPADADKPITAIAAKKPKGPSASASTSPSPSPYGELSLESFPKP